MPGRKYSNGSVYRYGFNGKEKSSEITIDDYDYGERIYDGRLGRWIAVDRDESNYPSIAPYVFAINSPLIFIDPNGKWVAKVVSGTDGNRRLSFIAEEGDNLSTLAMQLGISVDALKKLDPKLDAQLTTVTKDSEIGLENLKVVQRINKILNGNQINSNCANIAAGSTKSIDLENQYKNKGKDPTTDINGKPIDNVAILLEKLIFLTESTIAGAQIGSIMLFSPDLTPERYEQSITAMFETAVNKKRAEYNKKGLSGEQLEKKINQYIVENKATIDEESKEILSREYHYSILILKTKDGKNVSGIIQKQGQDPFKPEILPVSAATDGGIKYVPSSRTENNSSKNYYTDPKINN